jgi:hypothetical protein
MTNDDDRAREIDRALRAYRTPPPMPAGDMWAAIEAGLASSGPAVVPLSPWGRRIRPRLVTALAASLALFVAGTGVGFGVARWGGDADAAERLADGPAPEQTAVLYRVTWF